MPEASLSQLKAELPDPVGYFLGDDFGSLILPEGAAEYYGFPPSKSFVFEPLADYRVKADGFAPLMSFAAGGLAEAWTAGCYPFSDAELEAFPFGWSELEPAYSQVARRIGVSGTTADDLSQFYPAHDGIMPPIELDAHSRQLLEKYEGRRGRLAEKHGMYMGRARIASLSQDHNGRRACSLSGRCLWGCPRQSIYTPSITLELCRAHEGFEYLGGVCVERFVYDEANRVTHVVARALASGEEVRRDVGALVLAAGALASGRIVLESLLRGGVRAELRGLMDNRQVLMPFVNLERLGAPFVDKSYQYNQIAVGAPAQRAFDYVHGLVTTLTTGLIHPLVQSLPLGARAATSLFRNIHGALGLVNINFADTRREENRIALELDGQGRSHSLKVVYRPDPAEPERVRAGIRKFRRFLLSLGCFAPPNMIRLRPMGASVHYAGTLPMRDDGGDLTTDRAGRCRPFENLIVADGSTFPSLPAKNLTFTLMANATRIARETLAR
jgi:choline dehydrogenase-like flavoprotein